MIPTSLVFEIVCLVCALLYLRRPDTGHWRFFVPFMIFIIIVEGTGWSMGALFKIKNHWVYNIHLLAEFYFLTWLFEKFSGTWYTRRYIVDIAIVIFTSVFIVECCNTQFVIYNSKSSLLASVLIILYCGVYYYQLLKQSDHIKLLKHPEFWVVSGIFFFYFSSTAVIVFFKELMTINIKGGIPLRYFIFTVLNAILYGFWSYAFRCKKKQTILSSR